MQTCEADWTLEGSSHALEAVLDQMALKLRRGVERLTAELAFMVQSFLCREETIKRHKHKEYYEKQIKNKLQTLKSRFTFFYSLQ